MNRVEDFHKRRIMFYFWDGDLYIAQENDPRGHEEFIDNPEIFNTCVRGYYMDRKLVVYTDGAKFNSIKLQSLPKIIYNLVRALDLPMGISIHNGVKKGKPGDVWKLKNIFGM